MSKPKKQSFARGEVYTGPKGIFDGEEVGGVLAHYALDEDGKKPLLHGGKPVRLVQIDLAPDDPDDGSEEFRIAGPKDPAQTVTGRIVDLEPERAHSSTKAGA